MLAWHYTTGAHLPSIQGSGFLTPTAIGVMPPEKPILWFSMNQYWEESANKWITNGRDKQRLSIAEHLDIMHGLFRFGCDLRRLKVGEELRQQSLMSKAQWRTLVKEGLVRGAKPSEWCGSIKPISIADLVVQVMDSNQTWVAK